MGRVHAGIRADPGFVHYIFVFRNDATFVTDGQGERPAWFWTGLRPEVCPGFGKDGRLTSLPLPDTSKGSRQAVLDYFNNTWTLTEVLFSGTHRDARRNNRPLSVLSIHLPLFPQPSRARRHSTAPPTTTCGTR